MIRHQLDPRYLVAAVVLAVCIAWSVLRDWCADGDRTGVRVL